MSDTEIESELHKAVVDEDIYKIANDVCYDRGLCHRLGIDYIHIPNRDYNKAMLFGVYYKGVKHA